MFVKPATTGRSRTSSSSDSIMRSTRVGLLTATRRPGAVHAIFRRRVDVEGGVSSSGLLRFAVCLGPPDQGAAARRPDRGDVGQCGISTWLITWITPLDAVTLAVTTRAPLT